MENTYQTVSVDTTIGEQKDVVARFVEAARVLNRRESGSEPDDELPTGMMDRWAVPQSATFAGVFNWYQKYYYNYFDEAQIDSIENSIAMRRDGFIHELLRHRQLPTVALPHALECDDPDDPEQVKIKKQVGIVVDNIPYLQQMKLQLLEALYYGKSGSQMYWGKKKINGKKYNTVLKHDPVHGDKIVYDYDGNPGILVYSGATELLNDPNVKPHVEQVDKGTALFLRNSFFRDRFIIHEFERSDTDYLFESEKALAVHGLGLRDRFYWTWNMRAELIGWMFDALQRVGANGMLYAFFQSGNPTAQAETMNALRNLVKENIAAFPMQMGEAIDKIQHIDTAGIGYEVLYNLITHFEEIMRRGFLGQNLSSQSAATGLGSGVADLQAGTFENIILYDSSCLAETMDQQLVSKIINFNKWEYKGKFYNGCDLPFNIRLKLQVNRQNVGELIQAATALAQLGVPLDMEDLRDMTGLSAPKTKASTLVMPGGIGGQTDNSKAIESENAAPGKPQPEKPSGFPKKFGDQENFTVVTQPELFARDNSDPGILVSLTVPDEVRRKIAIPGGEDNLHITICYLGRLSGIGREVAEKARQVSEMLANNSRPISGTVGGFGRFSATDTSDGKDVIYACVDLPSLTDFRAELAHVFNLANIPYSKSHGYTPHVTLKYIDPDSRNPVSRIPNIPVMFNYLRFSIGDEVFDFPFQYPA